MRNFAHEDGNCGLSFVRNDNTTPLNLKKKVK